MGTSLDFCPLASFSSKRAEALRLTTALFRALVRVCGKRVAATGRAAFRARCDHSLRRAPRAWLEEVLLQLGSRMSDRAVACRWFPLAGTSRTALGGAAAGAKTGGLARSASATPSSRRARAGSSSSTGCVPTRVRLMVHATCGFPPARTHSARMLLTNHLSFGLASTPHMEMQSQRPRPRQS
eukprot:2043425-Pleurochrysis_carterae.AAC.3